MAEVLTTRQIGGCTLQLVQGDLTTEDTDAIINAANSQLLHGGGVAGAIVRAGGSQIQRESDAWVRQHGPVTHERPAWTTAGRLRAKYVLHAVGPVWGEGDEDAKLRAAVLGALQTAENLALESVSLPAISTGIFGFPKGRAADVILSAIRDQLSDGTSCLKVVRIVLMDAETIEIFRAACDGLA